MLGAWRVRRVMGSNRPSRLKTYQDLQVVDRAAMYGFLMRMKSPQGGFKMHDEGPETLGEGLIPASH